MNVLVVNCGSSSLKFQLINYDNRDVMAKGLCERIGIDGRLVYEPKNGEPIEVPIYQSTTFKYDNSEEMAMLFDLKKEGYFYTRLQNPTNDAVAKKIAQLEGGVGAVLTSSGQAANFYAVFNICEAGDHIAVSYTHLRARRPHRHL